MKHRIAKTIFLYIMILLGSLMVSSIAHELIHVAQTDRAEAICLSLDAEANGGAFAFVRGNFNGDETIDIGSYKIKTFELVAYFLTFIIFVVISTTCLWILYEIEQNG